MELYFPLILDGANGTELQKRGYTGDICAEEWTLEHPEVMREIQNNYIEAGSDVIYAPTFGANRVKLEENGIFNQVDDFNRRLVEMSKETAGGRALVAGDIATTGKFLAPLGDLTFGELYDIYLEQARALEEAGVDLFVIETIMTVPDARAALLAVRAVSDKPVLVSFTCDDNGRTLTGTDIEAALVIIQGMGADAFGLNCSSGPDKMLEHLRRISGLAEVPLAVKPNAGLPKVIDGKTVYDCPPDEFASYAGEFADAGAVIFGGCCGTDAGHVAALKSALDGISIKNTGSRNEVSVRKHDPEEIVCATEKDVFILKRGVRAGKVLACTPDLEDKIRAEQKNGAEVIAVRIAEDEDLDEFEAAQYAVRRPLCLVCNDAGLLDRALALYQGRALYAGELSDAELAPLVRKYGVII